MPFIGIIIIIRIILFININVICYFNLLAVVLIL